MGACGWGIMAAMFLLYGWVPPGMTAFSLCSAKSVVSVVCSLRICFVQILVSVM